MRFASALSLASDSAQAKEEAVAALVAGLDGRAADLVVAFATHHHSPSLQELGPRLAEATGSSVVIGCTAESVIGNGTEVEGRPGLALWAASMPNVTLRFFANAAMTAPGPDHGFLKLPEVTDPERAGVILVGDPFTFPVAPFLARLNDELPGVPVIGGMASGATIAGQNLLLTADGVRETGIIGVAVEGDVELRPVVSQGCRPVGKPLVITACEGNLIRKLGGVNALEVLMETWRSLPTRDQELLQEAPFIGLAIDPTQSHFARGDFLVRGILALHQSKGSIAVAEHVRRGQTIQIMLRDAASAGEDLSDLMASQGGGALEPAPGSGDPAAAHEAGALVFSCNGRGSRMFGEPDHDVSRVRSALAPDLPTAGFFASGEIGPVGRRNFLHGFTASVAVFRPRASKA